MSVIVLHVPILIHYYKKLLYITYFVWSFNAFNLIYFGTIRSCVLLEYVLIFKLFTKKGYAINTYRATIFLLHESALNNANPFKFEFSRI